MRTSALLAFALLALTPVSAIAETAKVNGIELHYTVEGAGEPLLLLHGFGGCAANWDGVATQLAQHYRLILVDMRGHGQSTNPSGKFTHAQSADDVRALLDVLAIKRVRAVGFSSGAMTLLHLATKSPDRVSKMVLVSATTHFPDQARAILKSTTIETTPPPILQMYRRCASRGDDQVRSLVAQFRAFGDNYDDMNFKPADLAKINAPTLIIHGDRDQFFPVSIPVAMYQSIPHAELWIVPGGSHSPTAGAEESTFVREVENFLRN
ncbi:MAG TPA: alpha/beta hydrolase [Bradyrhizobium sp.]|uniref:alpha/beta fold hydrolase n=1 Tax=Bradyrhizobium sp. TaxID=376 RepID=UPI002B49D827|nr:alpha/beta hydrolase [Bradyrhizobium sp.]HKO69955.1 alpha/beta hydrolase [Bradyrhizobium sp.]